MFRSGCNTYNQEKPATSKDAFGPTYLSHTLSGAYLASGRLAKVYWQAGGPR